MTPLPLRAQLLLLVGALVASTAAATFAAHSGPPAVARSASLSQPACAGPHWLVSAMADHSAAGIASLRPQTAAVSALRSSVDPGAAVGSGPASATPARVVRLTAGLVSGRVAADGTLAVVVSMPGTPVETLTVDFPPASCLGSAASGPAAAAVASARRAFEQGCGAVGASVTELAGSMTLEAVAMGSAELDPVTAVRRLSCRTAISSRSDAAGGSGSRR